MEERIVAHGIGGFKKQEQKVQMARGNTFVAKGREGGGGGVTGGTGAMLT